MTLIRAYPGLTDEAAEWKVLFFPHAGGSPASYQHLAASLSGSAHTAAVHYPGRGDRRHDPSFTSIHALAEDVAADFTNWCDGSPVLLFGHSLGAITAYETALRIPSYLRIVLVASGHPAPSRPQRLAVADPDEHSDERVVRFVQGLGGEASQLLAYPLLRDMLLPVIRADLIAHSSYHPTPHSTIPHPIISLQGSDDYLTTTRDMRAWEHHTRSAFRHFTFTGGHFFINDHIAPIAAILAANMLSSFDTRPAG